MKKIFALLAGLLVMGSTVSLADDADPAAMSPPQQESAQASNDAPAPTMDAKKKHKHYCRHHKCKHKHHHHPMKKAGDGSTGTAPSSSQ